MIADQALLALAIFGSRELGYSLNRTHFFPQAPGEISKSSRPIQKEEFSKPDSGQTEKTPPDDLAWLTRLNGHSLPEWLWMVRTILLFVVLWPLLVFAMLSEIIE